MRKFCILLGLVLCVSVAFAQANKATLAQQKLCSDEARKYVAAEGVDSLNYRNHYDVQSNACYVLFSVRFKRGYSIHVVDVLENEEYATYLEVNQKVEGCLAKEYGTRKLTTCMSEDTFDGMVRDYYGF